MTTCEAIERAVLEATGPLSAEVQAHLSTCEACRSFQSDAALVLGLAALPEPTDAERAAALQGLEGQVAKALEQQSHGRFQGLGRLALAAALGGVLAASGVLTFGPKRVQVVERERRVEVPVVAEFPAAVEWPTADSSNLSDDAVFDEVSWPSLTEGDAP
jgi:predicted anti-sigma-YlaC factor YlaD